MIGPNNRGGLFLRVAGTFLILSSVLNGAAGPTGAGLRLARFDVDVTPPVGSMLAYDPVIRVDELSLRCRGIAIVGAGDPMVLCAVDWISISNESQDAFRAALANAAGTSADRVAIHTVHQHDAPACDFSCERLLKEAGATDLGRFFAIITKELVLE